MLVTVALYWPATQCDFVNYDDGIYVTENPHVEGGLSWEGVKWAFCTTGQVANWHPLTMLSHMLDCQLFGLKPWGHHLTSVLLHAANSLLVFLSLRSLTGLLAERFGSSGIWAASVARGIGGVGGGRKDVLSTFFGLWHSFSTPVMHNSD